MTICSTEGLAPNSVEVGWLEGHGSTVTSALITVKQAFLSTYSVMLDSEASDRWTDGQTAGGLCLLWERGISPMVAQHKAVGFAKRSQQFLVR